MDDLLSKRVVSSYKSGKTSREIMDKENIGFGKFKLILKSNGVEMRRRGQRYIVPDRDKFINDCDRLRLDQLSEKYMVSVSKICDWKVKFSITDGVKHDRKILYSVRKDGCWKCTSHLSRKGYPRAKRGLVVKILWSEKNGEFPKGKDVRHLCGRKWCVNPSHVVPSAHFENLVDAILDGKEILKDGPVQGMLRRALKDKIIIVSPFSRVIRRVDGKVFNRFKYKKGVFVVDIDG